MVCWFVGWFVGLLVCWLGCWFVGWVVGWLVGWLVGWWRLIRCHLYPRPRPRPRHRHHRKHRPSQHWLVGCFVGWLVGWLVGSLVGWFMVSGRVVSRRPERLSMYKSPCWLAAYSLRNQSFEDHRVNRIAKDSASKSGNLGRPFFGLPSSTASHRLGYSSSRRRRPTYRTSQPRI